LLSSLLNIFLAVEDFLKKMGRFILIVSALLMGAVFTEGSWCKCQNKIGGPSGYTTDPGNVQACCTEIGRILSGDIFSGSACDLQAQEKAAFAACCTRRGSSRSSC